MTGETIADILCELRFEARTARDYNEDPDRNAESEDVVFTDAQLDDWCDRIEAANTIAERKARHLKQALEQITYDKYLLADCYAKGKCDACPYYTGTLKVGCAYRVAADALKEVVK